MHTSNYVYHHHDLELHGYLAFNDEISKPRPAILVFHDWTGRNEFACDKARALAEMGYIGFAVDMYGEARQGKTLEEKKGLMEPLINDRRLLRERVQAGLDAVKTMAEVDINRIAAIGFCFGGLCALDLARSGASIAGVVSFHGLLNKPDVLPKETIKAKVLVLHGYDDPMVPPGQVKEFCQEMTEAGVDWQVHMYGHTKHAFTNPKAHDEELGTVYDARQARRAWVAMSDFLKELFESR
ncbi:dienelactone hydrolase family protein [Legionella londiniensis]|uniref:Dienelactone hydrolase family transporter protein n=1 Tax=Legionella londiniensis TaxID=45068 RepID=A0A0W0VLL9_9GAMM|nr:dienelactone hydrolase family protein [Legionella londiniensis]KTD21026.1 dienelactone hydrolase family transporter protein [Legionella londiniensis]STX93699.1 carboxymethylenebutenolidase [Legionella londiniensis]